MDIADGEVRHMLSVFLTLDLPCFDGVKEAKGSTCDSTKTGQFHLAAGKRVIVEKPFVLYASQAEELMELAQQQQVGYCQVSNLAEHYVRIAS